MDNDDPPKDLPEGTGMGQGRDRAGRWDGGRAQGGRAVRGENLPDAARNDRAVSGGPDTPADPAAPDDGRAGLQVVQLTPQTAAGICNRLRDHWCGLRQGAAVPERSQIQPQAIRPLLDYAFILERIAPGAARFRLAGRHLVDLMGMEVRGMPLCAMMNPTSRGRLADILESVFKAPQIAELMLDSPADYGRPALTGRLLLLPLRSDLGDITRALGCLVAEGQMGRAPRRFDLSDTALSPVITGAKVLTPSPSRHGFDEDTRAWRPPAALSPRLPPISPDATPEQRRARFRIIRDDTTKPTEDG
ncbi:PAS domain-containing protein [Paracoccus jiaweipingae]|uniref:PAS domain-containing protein n=1 Tax=unclassified Paracoccus (in: a-proteobacteria) TaxID=2688777 RepID=UPI0037A94B67